MSRIGTTQQGIFIVPSSKGYHILDTCSIYTIVSIVHVDIKVFRKKKLNKILRHMDCIKSRRRLGGYDGTRPVTLSACNFIATL